MAGQAAGRALHSAYPTPDGSDGLMVTSKWQSLGFFLGTVGTTPFNGQLTGLLQPGFYSAKRERVQ